MKKKKNPHQNYGMGYDLFSKQDKARRAAPSTVPTSLVVWACTLFFMAADFFVIRGMTNKIITESAVAVTFTAAGITLALDLSLSILGNVWAQYNAGLRERRDFLGIMAACLVAFWGGLAIYAWLRIVKRDAIAAGATGLISLAGSAAETQDNLPVAVFMAFLPVVTSALSLALSLAQSHPMKERLRMLEDQKTRLQEELASVEASLAECADLDAEILQAEEDEETQYQEFLRSIDIQAARLKQTARILLMAKMQEAESISILTSQAQALFRQEPALLPAPRASGNGGQPLPENYAA